ncbi:FAD binding domain-containing protein, partial [Triangularia verruculosa]
SLPVLIVGAGLVGLALAQALKKVGVPFRIFERDVRLHARASGWGISVSPEALQRCLPEDLVKQIYEIKVDPQQKATSIGFFNLESGEEEFKIPSSFRLRVDRGLLRTLLATGIDVEWDKTVTGFRVVHKTIFVSFQLSDGKLEEVQGSVLTGADGTGSKIRKQLLGLGGDHDGRKNLVPRPVHHLMTTVHLTEDQFSRLYHPVLFQGSHPVLFQGSHPGTGYYMFYSTLSSPNVNSSSGTNNPYYEAQLEVSWISKDPDDMVPCPDTERVPRIKSMAAEGTGFYENLRDIINKIPDDAHGSSVVLQDWPTEAWDGFGGRVTLLGDAAHPMTMYRGEAANQGFRDASLLSEQLKLWHCGQKDQETAVADYEAEMIPRGKQSVLDSRQACFDAHDLSYLKLHPDSPL